MSEQSSTQQPQQQTPLTWQNILDTQIFCSLTPSIYHLKWPLFTPLSSILVLSDPTDPSSLTTPFTTTDTETQKKSYHSISSQALTNPPLSSLTVTVDALTDYYDEFNPDEESPRLTITPTEKPYITIGDYVLALHPWLNDLEAEILTAFEELYGPRGGGVERVPGNGVKMWVWMGVDPSGVVIQEEEVAEEWPEKKWEGRCEIVKGLIEGYERRVGTGTGTGTGS